MGLGGVRAVLSESVYREAYVGTRAQHNIHQRAYNLLILLTEIGISHVGCVHLQFCSSYEGGVGQGAVSHCELCEDLLDVLFLADAEGIF